MCGGFKVKRWDQGGWAELLTMPEDRGVGNLCVGASTRHWTQDSLPGTSLPRENSSRHNQDGVGKRGQIIQREALPSVTWPYSLHSQRFLALCTFFFIVIKFISNKINYHFNHHRHPPPDLSIPLIHKHILHTNSGGLMSGDPPRDPCLVDDLKSQLQRPGSGLPLTVSLSPSWLCSNRLTALFRTCYEWMVPPTQFTCWYLKDLYLKIWW